jgi:hypothetical protein
MWNWIPGLAPRASHGEASSYIGRWREGNRSLAEYVPEDKDLSSLRDDPRFAELLAE